MSDNNELIEKYGNPRLTWGYYPISADYNLGGCGEGCESSEPIDELSYVRARERKLGMEQRGGNNPMEFHKQVDYTKYEVGTGCYNPKCKCHNCHGNCFCEKQNNTNTHNSNELRILQYADDGIGDAFTWIGMIALTYFIYKLFFKRK